MPTGGNGNYEYSTTGVPVQLGFILENLTAGTYTIMISDRNGCTNTCLAILPEPDVLTCSAAVVANVSCNGQDGSATAIPVGGTTPYSYLWDNGETTATAIALTPTAHTVTVTDVNGCTTSCAVTLGQNPPVSCTVVTSESILCSGTTGSLTASSSGGDGNFEYSLDGIVFQPSPIFTGLLAGPYTITTRDGRGCTANCIAMLLEPALLTCSTTLVSNVSCNGLSDGSATVVPLGGVGPFTYTWDSGETTALAMLLNAGTHTVTVTDANGCVTTCTGIITEPVVLTCTTATTIVTDCGINDGSITLTAVGGTAGYTFDAGLGTVAGNLITGLAPGNYIVTVTDANSCTSSCAAVISSLNVPTCSVSNIVNVDCNGNATGSYLVTGMGGNSTAYNFTDGTVTNSDGIFTAVEAGTYTITVSYTHLTLPTILLV